MAWRRGKAGLCQAMAVASVGASAVCSRHGKWCAVLLAMYVSAHVCPGAEKLRRSVALGAGRDGVHDKVGATNRFHGRLDGVLVVVELHLDVVAAREQGRRSTEAVRGAAGGVATAGEGARDGATGTTRRSLARRPRSRTRRWLAVGVMVVERAELGLDRSHASKAGMPSSTAE